MTDENLKYKDNIILLVEDLKNAINRRSTTMSSRVNQHLTEIYYQTSAETLLEEIYTMKSKWLQLSINLFRQEWNYSPDEIVEIAESSVEAALLMEGGTTDPMEKELDERFKQDFESFCSGLEKELDDRLQQNFELFCAGLIDKNKKE